MRFPAFADWAAKAPATPSMFARRKGAKRFTLLLLEDEEDYVADWVGVALRLPC